MKTKRGKGTFVTDNKAILSTFKEMLKIDQMTHFVSEMTEMGFSDEEMIHELQEYFQVKEDKKT